MGDTVGLVRRRPCGRQGGEVPGSKSSLFHSVFFENCTKTEIARKARKGSRTPCAAHTLTTTSRLTTHDEAGV